MYHVDSPKRRGGFFSPIVVSDFFAGESRQRGTLARRSQSANLADRFKDGSLRASVGCYSLETARRDLSFTLSRLIKCDSRCKFYFAMHAKRFRTRVRFIALKNKILINIIPNYRFIIHCAYIYIFFFLFILHVIRRIAIRDIFYPEEKSNFTERRNLSNIKNYFYYFACFSKDHETHTTVEDCLF